MHRAAAAAAARGSSSSSSTSSACRSLLTARPRACFVAGQRRRPAVDRRQLHAGRALDFRLTRARPLDLTPPGAPPAAAEPGKEDEGRDVDASQEATSTSSTAAAAAAAAPELATGSTVASTQPGAAHAKSQKPDRSKTSGQTVQESRDRGASSSYGSASRRWQRNRRPRELPPVHIPQWFLERNVMLHDSDANLTQGVLTIDESSEPMVEESTKGSTSDEHAGPRRHGAKRNTGVDAETKQGDSQHGDRDSRFFSVHASQMTGLDSNKAGPTFKGSLAERHYKLHRSLHVELGVLMSASFAATQATKPSHFPASRSHLKLHAPLDGASYFLDIVLERTAKDLGADVIRLDAQDIAELAGDYITEAADARQKGLWMMGYDTHKSFAKQLDEELDEGDDEGLHDEGGADEGEFEVEPVDRTPSREGRGRRKGTTSIVIGANFQELLNGASHTMLSLADQLPQMMKQDGSRNGASHSGGSGLPASGASSSGAQQWNEMKLNNLLESLVETNQIKRLAFADMGSSAAEKESSESSDGTPAEAAEKGSSQAPRTIIHVKDFKELSATPAGGHVMDKLLNAVESKRKEGQQIMIVGTTSSRELMPEYSRSAVNALQAEGSASLYRTMIVTPQTSTEQDDVYSHDEWYRTWEVNSRNLQDMINRLAPGSEGITRDLIAAEGEPGAQGVRKELGEKVFGIDKMHRIASAYVGSGSGGLQFSSGLRPELATKSNAILDAMAILQASDHEKSSWTKRAAREEEQLGRGTSSGTASKDVPSPTQKLVQSLKQSCDKYEQRLLHGVVDTQDIRTTFKDVHAPPETVEALKDLTSLSLTRPDAFEYGVLATDKITGALLYGPPGTGKTLLAKAVAKESGATVLEVSGSDVYDMFVGEGEKLVRAIFTLAKKLTPCVVFIDEADAIFSSRGNKLRNSHREIINQFLREWDGMTDTNAFVMVATNRPFDLDDAALRRLPRRLLVDLPDEKDRAAILAIHLKEEQLDAAVSIADLAQQTRLYSGSDLKNLAVAAALAAVREENDAAARHREQHPDRDYAHPDRRILATRHFDRAMTEITSSVSDDMGSLQAIKKFDEQYGDRRARRSRKTYGFSVGEPQELDTAKVRV